MTAIRSFAASDVGLVRGNNEDSFLADDRHRLYVVADGMGGQAKGEVASATTVETIRQTIADRWDEVEALTAQDTPEAREQLAGILIEAMSLACTKVHNLSAGEPKRLRMGSTCVAVLCSGSHAVLGHVGDSRAYLYRRGQVHRLTDDHSLAAEQVRRGFLTEEQADTSPTRNILLRAIGLEEMVTVDSLVTELTPGDTLLLCTDGIWEGLPESRLVEWLGQEGLEGVPLELIRSSHGRGGKDNATAVVVSIEAEESGEADHAARLEALRRVPLFQDLAYKDLLELISISRMQRYAPGEAVVREGEPGNHMYALARGTVEVSRANTTVARLGAGGYFGEMVLFDKAPRSATVTAVEPTTALGIDRDGLLRLMQRDQALANKLLWGISRVLATRLRATNEALAHARAADARA